MNDNTSGSENGRKMWFEGPFQGPVAFYDLKTVCSKWNLLQNGLQVKFWIKVLSSTAVFKV